MSSPSAPRRLLACLTTALFLATSCSGKDDDDSASTGDNGDGGSTAIETGPGVTDDTITLGVLTDQSGPFAALATSIAQGRQLFWDARNADGGVCDRSVEFTTSDHGYNAQNATSLYADMQPDVLAFAELLGSPMIAALLPAIGQDTVPTMAVSWSSNLLDSPYIVIAGTTYDLEMINVVQWLLDEGRIAEGDTIGHIYLEGDYGENALAGAQYAAEELGLEISAQRVQPTDNDLTAPVTALDDAGASIVLLTTTPAQTASAVSVAQANGLGMGFVGSNPTFSPSLLTGPAAGSLEASYEVVQSFAPYTSEGDGPDTVREAFDAEFAGESPTAYVFYGYAQAEVMAQILETACDNGALTRDGLQEAIETLGEIDTDGLVAPLDFSEPGQPAAHEVVIAKPDADVEGGLTEVAGLFASPLAAEFRRG
jgi:ABC-type branched-subunit amino acid transport system substrate-binding protein